MKKEHEVMFITEASVLRRIYTKRKEKKWTD